MEYESVQEMAERLGVTVRAVQKWAAAGRIPGAEKTGRTWFIPKGAAVLDTAGVRKPEPEPGKQPHPVSTPDGSLPDPSRMAMPLLNSAFPVGKCKEYIQAISDMDDRNIALGEYYFFSGRPEEAAKTAEPYLNSDDPSLHYSASLICTFANLARGHIHPARFAMKSLQKQVKHDLHSDAPPQLQAMGIFMVTTASVLLHLDVPATPPLKNYLRYLPDGLRLYACYVMAHKAYLEQNYERSFAIAETGLAMCLDTYPIAAIYVHLIAVMDLMSLKRTEEAKQHLAMAWELAQPDDLIEPFGEHHGLLQGMIEVFFKENYPAEFERIIAITYSFGEGWRKVHNPDANEKVADNLTTTEFTVAMLYNRGWTAKEIAGHMGFSERTVNRHIAAIYAKLDISDKDMLERYMLR